ncbi:hypothetical protein [Streptomyces sp. YS-3]|uniref:hypothetical protein n=1 Tax=Streptomyces sp. YS-3 TaxID=3381352 RepID=UPI00386260B1
MPDGPVTPAASGGHPAAQGTVDPGRPAEAWPSGQPTPSGFPSNPAVPPHASVVCNFTASQAPLEIDLVATSMGGVAVNLALPQIARLGALRSDEVMAFSEDKPGIGQTRITPGRGAVAVARAAVAGTGDLALVVSQGWPVTKADPALAGESLRKVAETLAAQLRPWAAPRGDPPRTARRPTGARRRDTREGRTGGRQGPRPGLPQSFGGLRARGLARQLTGRGLQPGLGW